MDLFDDNKKARYKLKKKKKPKHNKSLNNLCLAFCFNSKENMEWAEDLFTLKKSAKKGRRAAAAAEATSSATTTDTQTIPITLEKLPNHSRNNSFDDELDNFEFQTMPKPKKAGGWATEPIKSGKNKAPSSNIIEQERFGSPMTTTTGNLSEDEIPVIPDLDDMQDDLLLNEMVEAPVVSVNRVATYKELNSELLKQGAFAALEDIDLSILARCLQNESALHEPDDVWTWEHMFTEVSAEIHSDLPKSNDIPTTQFVN